MRIVDTIIAGINIKGPLPEATADQARITLIMNTLLAIFGAIAVLIIVIAGFRYIMSRGDPGAVAKAKDAIVYALVGLVVMISAYGIVGFALNVF